jgi:hypothetical protein
MKQTNEMVKKWSKREVRGMDESWEKQSETNAGETPLCDNSHDEVFQRLVVASVKLSKWSQRVMYTLQTGAFDLPDNICELFSESFDDMSGILMRIAYKLMLGETLADGRTEKEPKEKSP